MAPNGLTFGHVETWEEEFAVSNAPLTSASITDNRSNEVANKFNVRDELFGGYVFRKCR